ncbi:MAG TPA: substrate-binding domain-containing protein [Paludibacteraceae bacterium]|nr:substrate-binding domain-containing protein [Paludibacteraceae bacterium]
MKNALTFLLLILTFIFNSCVENKKDFIIGVSQCSDDAWRRSMNEEMQREASFSGNIDLRIKTAYDNNQRQIRDIEELIAENVDLLIVSPNEAAPLTPVIEKAMDEAIPVILVDRKIASNKYTAFVGADNFQIGKEVGIYASQLLNGKGNVVEIRGLKGSTPDLERHNGFVSSLSHFPEIKIVYESDGAWLRSEANKRMSEALSKVQSIDLVFAHNDEMAIGVYEALNSSNDIKKPIILGIDALPGADGGIERVLNGSLDATFIYPTGGEKAIQTALQILNKKPFSRENVLYTAVVDKTNARVLKLQTDQIIQHQNRISKLNEILNINLSQYTTQRMLLLSSLVVLGVILLLLILLFRSYRHKNRVNSQLEKTNDEINRQKEVLSEQRDQLVTLSKNMEDATQAKLVFFTNISHEFRTPLTLISGPLDNIAANEQLSTEGKKMVRMMKRNVHVLLRLIDQIIEFRRYENGKMQMFFRYDDLKKFIGEICGSFRELSRKKRINLKYVVDNADFMVWFDTDKVEKICYNLISNALKFTHENGNVTVHLSKELINDEEYAKITVTDTGIGISNDHLSEIFSRFYRVDNSYSGSGIGLALTKALVEQHNGNIGVESSVGQGSTFYFSIPFKQKDISVTEQYPVLQVNNVNLDDVFLADMEDETEVAEDQNRESNKQQILIVEDNYDVRGYVKSILQAEFDIIEASNGKEGLLKAMRKIPDLIISDVMMEGMNGFELCKAIKENINTSHIPVMLLTAYALDEQRVTGFQSGADAYIPKPFNEELLKIRVRKLIENREKLKEYFKKNLTFGEKKESVAEIDKTFMDKFRQIVEDNLLNSELSVDDIGKSIGMSRVQLYRKMKSLTNYAPNELVRNIRLKKAEQLIINSDKNISEIAYETGFSSPSYFSKCFKEYFNESPKEFISRMKE